MDILSNSRVVTFFETLETIVGCLIFVFFIFPLMLVWLYAHRHHDNQNE